VTDGEGNVINGLDVTITGVPVDSNTAGSYTISATLNNSNYIVETVKDATLIIEKAPVMGTINYQTFSMTLDGVVYLNYYMTFNGFAPDINFAEAGGVVVWTGDTAPTKAAQLEIGKENCLVLEGITHNENGWSVQSPDIVAKCLGDLVYMRPYVEVANGIYVYGPAKYYSPELYCKDQMKNQTMSAEVKNVCAALLQYGASAQIYFDYKTDALVTNGVDLSGYDLTFDAAMIDPLKPLTAERDGAKVATLEGTRANINFATATLALEGAIVLHVGYHMPSSIDFTKVNKAEVLFWTEEAYANASTLAYSAETYSYKSEMKWDAIDTTQCYVAVSDYIVAKALSETVYFSVRVEMNDGTVYKSGINWYSPEAYVSDMLNTTDSELLDVIQAITVYSEKARICFLNN